MSEVSNPNRPQNTVGNNVCQDIFNRSNCEYALHSAVPTVNTGAIPRTTRIPQIRRDQDISNEAGAVGGASPDYIRHVEGLVDADAMT